MAIMQGGLIAFIRAQAMERAKAVAEKKAKKVAAELAAKASDKLEGPSRKQTATKGALGATAAASTAEEEEDLANEQAAATAAADEAAEEAAEEAEEDMVAVAEEYAPDVRIANSACYALTSLLSSTSQPSSAIPVTRRTPVWRMPCTVRPAARSRAAHLVQECGPPTQTPELSLPMDDSLTAPQRAVGIQR